MVGSSVKNEWPMQTVNVTKSFLPPIEEFNYYVSKIWKNGQLTNQGPLLIELEQKIKGYLEVSNFHFLTNGTIALQVALRSLGITEGEVITTPFSYVATTSSILWERCTPVYVDINPSDFCIDVSKIEAAITPKTKAIMAVHVFGNPCDVEAIDKIAKKHSLKVIYDGAHAFGVRYKGRSLLGFGDITMCSFHATKLFHTIEGGGLVVGDDQVSDTVEYVKKFGHYGDEHYMLGINAKASEFQAAMGLANLPYIEEIIAARKKSSELYDALLPDHLKTSLRSSDVVKNYAYYPIVFKSENDLLFAMEKLKKNDIYARRYFYPSLNKLPYIDSVQECPVSEDITRRILCLPLYHDIEDEMVKKICGILA